MHLRIRVRDLPKKKAPRPAENPAALYELLWFVGRQQHSAPIPLGESYAGSSAKCEVRMEGAGVRARHLRIKHEQDRVFIQAVGGAKVMLAARRGAPEAASAIEALTRVEPGQSFTFGSVTARVVRTQPGDRDNAVPIASAAGRAATTEAAGDPRARELRTFLDALPREGGNPERLLEALQAALTPAAATLFRKRGKREWTILAQCCASSGSEAEAMIDDPDAADFERYAFQRAAEPAVDEYLLAVNFFDRVHADWQDQLCRLTVLLAAQPPGTPRPSPADAPPQAQGVWDEFVGSRIRAELASCVELCRHTDTVLVAGETGTGKELVARALHRLWQRPGAFVALNCAAVPGDLLDAELFGVETGAATGVSARAGRLEQANHGTLFLDEITELPMHLQSKLLRVLQEREYNRVGATRLQKADVKVIAATNHPVAYLRGGEGARHMRPDLFFRLSQSIVLLPPLRERVADIAALAEQILNQLEAQYRRGIAGLSASALRRLKGASWPGNVRELQNVLRRAYTTAAQGELIQSIHLALDDPAESSEALPPSGKLEAILTGVQRSVVERELARTPSMAAAARALGVSEGYLYRLVRKLKIKRKLS